MIHFGQGSTKRPSLGLEKLGPFLWKLTGSASRGGLSACGPVGVGGYLNCSNKPQWITVQVGQGFGVELSGSDTRTKAQVQVLEPGTACARTHPFFRLPALGEVCRVNKVFSRVAQW